VIALTLALTVVSVGSAQNIPTVEYRIQQGDTLTKIAAKFCTTWEEVYHFNAGIIGTDPDNLQPGTLIYVIPRCGSQPPTTPPGNVYDRGPRMHANGTVKGNVYTVAWGDTLYSVGLRFGLPWEQIASANGVSKVYAGQRIIIPGLAQSPTPPAKPASVAIVSPTPGSYVGHSFCATGTGENLYEGNVVVRVRDGNNDVIAEQATVLQGDTVGVGGPGVWSVCFQNVGGQPESNGAVQAFSPESNVSASVSIWFRGY
jgi:LysM repeat protein